MSQVWVTFRVWHVWLLRETIHGHEHLHSTADIPLTCVSLTSHLSISTSTTTRYLTCVVWLSGDNPLPRTIAHDISLGSYLSQSIDTSTCTRQLTCVSRRHIQRTVTHTAALPLESSHVSFTYEAHVSEPCELPSANVSADKLSNIRADGLISRKRHTSVDSWHESFDDTYGVTHLTRVIECLLITHRVSFNHTCRYRTCDFRRHMLTCIFHVRCHTCETADMCHSITHINWHTWHASSSVF